MVTPVRCKLDGRQSLFTVFTVHSGQDETNHAHAALLHFPLNGGIDLVENSCPNVGVAC